VSLLVALTTLRLFRPDGPDPAAWSATDDGTRLATVHIPDAPDLVLHPPTDLTHRSEEYDDDALAG